MIKMRSVKYITDKCKADEEYIREFKFEQENGLISKETATKIENEFKKESEKWLSEENRHLNDLTYTVKKMQEKERAVYFVEANNTKKDSESEKITRLLKNELQSIIVDIKPIAVNALDTPLGETKKIFVITQSPTLCNAKAFELKDLAKIRDVNKECLVNIRYINC